MNRITLPYSRLLPALLALALHAPPAVAWNAAGHRLSALIAWQQLDGPTREKVSGLLARHPDYTLWEDRTVSDSHQMTIFVEASTWADEIRYDSRFHDADGETTRLLPGFPDMQRHRDWHYVNRPLTGSPATSAIPGQLAQRLEVLASELGNPRIRVQQRAYALVWLIHLVGDVHQPLHVVSRYDASGQGDQGGNRLLINNPQNPRSPLTNLHAYWDELPAPPSLRGERLEALAATISAMHPPTPPAGGFQRWLQESWQIARESAYPAPDGFDPPTITAEFHARASAVAKRRIAEAGYRLADLLRKLVGKETGLSPD